MPNPLGYIALIDKIVSTQELQHIAPGLVTYGLIKHLKQYPLVIFVSPRRGGLDALIKQSKLLSGDILQIRHNNTQDAARP
jgi:hypothetical protein